MSSRKIIQIGEHKIQLPPYPSSKDDILFYNEKGAYWRRQEDFPRIWYDYNKYYTALDQENTMYDQDGRLVALSVKDSLRLKGLQTRELLRRRHGVWFKNYDPINKEDQIMWMPGDYYFNLQWAPMLGLSQKYGDFRWFQNDAMILKHHVDTDSDISGLFLAKAKKTGISQILAGSFANESTMIVGKNFGIMSKTFDDDAKALNMALYFHIIEGMPDILLPELKKKNEHEILWGKSKQWRQLKTATVPLNTRVYASKTKPSGFDGPVMYWIWLDEFPKYWESAHVSPGLVYKKTQETIKKQQVINGKQYLTSYVPENNDRGYLEAKEIYFDSKLSTKDKVLNRTKTNMICHTIGTLESAEGCFNRNGKTDQKKAYYFNQAERDQVKGDRLQLQAKMRQYPRNEEEAWGSSGASSVFDPLRIAQQIKDLDDELKSGVRPYQEGKLVWANPLWEEGKYDVRKHGQFTTVYFEPLTEQQIMNGEEERLHIFEMPTPAEQCKVLKRNLRDEKGRLVPFEFDDNVGSIDPTDYAAASDVAQGSKNASKTGNLYNPAVDTAKGRVASNILISEYFFRPENPDEFYEDMVKEIIFFGKRVLVEGNKKWVWTKLKNDNLHNFMLVLKADGTIAPYKESEDDNKMINTTHQLIDAYIRAIKRYFAEVKGGVGIDYLKYFKSIRTLKQCSNFKAEDTRLYDLVVDLGLWRIAVESFSVFRENNKPDLGEAEGVRVAMAGLLNI